MVPRVILVVAGAGYRRGAVGNVSFPLPDTDPEDGPVAGDQMQRRCGLRGDRGIATSGAHHDQIPAVLHHHGRAALRTAQTLLRHANLQTTAIYIQVVDGKRVEAIDRLNPYG